MDLYLIALKSSLALVAFWAFLSYLWRDYRVDAFRDHVFGIRHRLFLFAASGGVSFRHPAYTMLRYRMNVILRYAHLFTLFRVFAIILFRPVPTKNSDRARWQEAVESLPYESKKQMREFDTVLAIAILQLMIYRSFFLYLVARPLMPFVQTRDVLEHSPTVVTRVEQLESDALEEERVQREEPVPA